ncbi:hypothetical protein MKZ38_004120 [Zalerion maritima]|uniref:aldehyde dehydrogenase (NAD(+)) n=1 Tax=Zalerion maritima TaxID=339359 RepID=A0AAD5RLX8_9PEZI|nr:hypothetical protein MKZ38_004120 [Zalerion maritima]
MDTLVFFNIINNDKCSGAAWDAVVAPRSGKPLWDVPLASLGNVNTDVGAAQEAFRSWKQTAVEQRKALLSKIIGQETGKSTLMSDLEVDDCISFVTFNAAQSLEDEVAFQDETLKIINTHQPLGVVAAIFPWNFPLVLAMGKIAAGLVTGNCFVELASQVLPPGVLQELNGGGDVGAMLVKHRTVQKVSFTGSTAAGKRIMESASGTLKRITLELGGNDGCIVCHDVDVQSVAREVAVGCFFHSGQMCLATKRIYVRRDVYALFLSQFLREFAVVKSLIEDCEHNDYEILAGGTKGMGKGLWIPPTVVNNPPDDSRIVKEEQFGPIIPLLTWDTEEEVIRRVNNTDCGLGASMCAKDQERAQRLARSLDMSSIWVNHFPKPVPMGHLSSWKESGFGGEWGRAGLLAYCQVQTLQVYKSKAREYM